jgi:hypothetical protein
MRLGEHLPTLIYNDWRFVEEDMFDVCGRVQQYDPGARLVRYDESKHLALAVWNDKSPVFTGGAWMVAKRMYYPGTDDPWTGEPDARILEIQRAADSHRITNMAEWRRKEKLAWEAENEAREREARKHSEEFADGFVDALRAGDDSSISLYLPSRVARQRLAQTSQEAA